MKTLNEVVKKQVAVFAFGRMNPPTSGHEKLIAKVLAVAKKLNATPFIFVSNSQDAKKNPLTGKQKVKYIELGVPGAEGHVYSDTTVLSPFHAVKYLENNGFTDVVLVTGSDRLDLGDSIKKYINHPDPTKGFKLNSFDIVSAGDRDPDADGVTGMSASKMREAAADNNFRAFKKGVPSKLSDRFAKEMFDAVRTAMDIQEMVEQVQKLNNTLNIPRREMPQIKKKFISDFLDVLKDRGVSIHTRDISVSSLKPTQNEIDLDKVKEKLEKFHDGKEPKPFVVSYDNFILDGHHQLFALRAFDKNTKVKCYVVDLSMKDLLKYAYKFPKTTYKNIDE
jgi:hypothetical protein